MGQIADAYKDYEKNKLQYHFTSPTFQRSKAGPQLKTFIDKATVRKPKKVRI